MSPLSLALTFFLLILLPVEVRSNSDGELLVDKNVTFALELLSPLSTEVSKRGDKFECKVLSPAQLGGSIVSGHIRNVKNSGKGKGKSEMDLAFDTITLTDGRVGGFNASVLEVNDVVHAGNDGVADNEGTVKGKSKVKVGVKRAVAGALIGAGIGAVLAGGKGAVAGAMIGAGVGVTSTLIAEGPNLEFKTGSQFTVKTDSPSHRKNSNSKQ
ncbi:MAG TPA: hypothetical protein VK582_12205 [Pyrinomonadaceae bacterium]|nr:hypothetical protein [Pyrinomonadaceae bacterium]